jgi:hypothetical protein
MVMIGSVLWTKEPGCPARRIGKCVPIPLNGGAPGYIFDNPALYKRLNAYGVSETVLVEMIRSDVRQLHYIVGSNTLIADRDAVIEHGFRDTMLGARGGYIYYPVKRWTVHPGRIGYPWVSESNRLDLDWRIDAEEIAMWRRRLIAARPVEPRQMALFA